MQHFTYVFLMFSTNRIFPTNPWSHFISTLPKQQPALLAHCNCSTPCFVSTPYRTHILYILTEKTITKSADRRGLMFARNPPISMWDCNLLCCFGACFSQTASIWNIDVACVSWHSCACLTRCQHHLWDHVLKIAIVICDGPELKPQQTGRLWMHTKIANPE